MMHQLINSWNKTHKPYFLVVNCFLTSVQELI